MTFEADVLPILRQHCGDCHGSEVQEGDLQLLSRDSLVLGGQSGPAFEVGTADASLVVKKIARAAMPPDGPPVPANQLETIRRWIEQGGRRDGESLATAAKQIAAASTSQQDVFVNVFFTHCLDCHGKWKQEAGLDLRTRESLLKGGTNGPAMVPGDPRESLVYQRLLADEMPPKENIFGDQQYVTRVPVSDIEALRTWIEAGAPGARAYAARRDPVLSPERLDHWAFHPPVRPRPPRRRGGQRNVHPVDRFIISRLRENKLDLSDQAESETLVRRAFFTLTGLPPGLADVQQHREQGPGYDLTALIDRLLESPRYGEHQASWWLDGAGYADTHGQINRDEFRPFMWRYRDYVIRAFNSDKPYDRFLTEQLAGDELHDWKNLESLEAEQIEALVATGFLRTASDATDEGSFNKLVNRMGVISEQIEIVSSSLMGLTLECARCHSHKFDPIPQLDYYRFAAIFRPALDPYDWRIPNVVLHPPKYVVPDRYRRDLFHPSDVPPDDLAEIETRRAKKIEQLTQKIRDADGHAETGLDALRAELKVLEDEQLQGFRIHGLSDTGGEPTPVHLLKRGDIRQPAQVVQPGPPVALEAGLVPYQVVPSGSAMSSGRRLALARWLTQPHHPLTARVLVNRVWQHHFGRGLVDTPGNFGRIGATPSHPELLDWLATEFVREGWSIRKLHRLIMTSATWRQSSRVDMARETSDPENLLLSRFPLSRLPSESIRDSILQVSGQLDLSSFGPPVEVSTNSGGEVFSAPREGAHRRSIYLVRRRKTPHTLLDLFDSPAMVPNCLARANSTVPTQALQLFNSLFVRTAANDLAERVFSLAQNDTGRIQVAYQVAFGRLPAESELDRDKAALDELGRHWHNSISPDQPPSEASEMAERRALASYCHALLNSPEFIYLD